MRKSIVSIFAISATIMLTLADNEAMAGKIGVVGLYKTGEQAEAVADDQKVHNLGCQIRREGIIGNEDGDIDINKSNRFVFLACDSSILANPAKRLRKSVV